MISEIQPSFYLELRRTKYKMVTLSSTGAQGFAYVVDWYSAFALAWNIYPRSIWRQERIGKRIYFFENGKRRL